jgi:molecular chaperone HscC
VELCVPQTGERRQLVIQDSESPMDDKALAQRREALAHLKVHPRDQDVNRALIARASRCYEEALGPRREHVGACLNRFQATLEAQDPRAIEHEREEFSKLLDSIEGETFL